ncbi:hypothetical protein [Nocardia huaxiensis]|uniref:Uncharacterized protein n=1 Tax=Nocardia huaxiensis TaxID=2755382 RepID=A0A7D6Z0C7_9NOCA|nr:hypothetical protein [Nocardia huaxiensis]QLY29326.1 hypothetical protein H0264_29220 [Nocardia huaxiensis]UFS97197.1 hypothetical protein LPY97_04510 [Nocardia huaxiensis]
MEQIDVNSLNYDPDIDPGEQHDESASSTPPSVWADPPPDEYEPLATPVADPGPGGPMAAFAIGGLAADAALAQPIADQVGGKSQPGNGVWTMPVQTVIGEPDDTGPVDDPTTTIEVKQWTEHGVKHTLVTGKDADGEITGTRHTWTEHGHKHERISQSAEDHGKSVETETWTVKGVEHTKITERDVTTTLSGNIRILTTSAETYQDKNGKHTDKTERETFTDSRGKPLPPWAEPPNIPAESRLLPPPPPPPPRQ